MSNTISGTLVNRSKFIELREQLLSLCSIRRTIKNMKDLEQQRQIRSLALMRELAIGDQSVGFDVDGERHAAKLIRTKSADTWNLADLVEWLKGNPTLWRKVSTTILDTQKLEAEIAAGNIKREDVERFVIPGDERSPYIKFVNVTPDSL
jgi:hypothetical protein